MNVPFQEVIKKFEEFRVIFEQTHPPLDKCQDLMQKLKIAVTPYSFPGTEKISLEEQRKRLLLCRDVFECGALLSVKLQDIPSFERYMAQLKNFYYDYGTKYQLQESARKNNILGLNLLRLLSKNKLDEFHTELELLPPETHSNVYIKHPIMLEQFMMEGAYNKVIKAKSNVPSEYYSFFMDNLMGTVRNELADCIEIAFTTLSVSEAAKLLAFSSQQDFQKWVKERNWKVIKLNGTDYFDFQKPQESQVEIPSHSLIAQTLQYAREMERIV